MKEDDDFFDDDNSEINNLIQYSDDSNTSDTENHEEDSAKPESDSHEESDENEEYDIDEYFDDIYIDPKPRSKDKSGTGFGILFGVLAGIAIAAIFMTVDSGIIGRYKNNFTANFSKVFANFKSDKPQYSETPSPDSGYSSKTENSVIVSLDEANNTEFMPYKNGIICARMNYMSFIDKTGAIVWETETAIVNPILKTSGNYIMLAEDGRNKICLYESSKLLYDTDDPDSIIGANVSSNGDVIAVTNKSSYKGGISVYNKTGARIFSWASGSDIVLSADISASSRRAAVSLLNTDTAAKSSIMLFNINQSDSYAKVEADNTVIFDISFKGDVLNAFGDNRIVGISDSGKVVYNTVFDKAQLTHSASDDRGNKLLSLDDGNIPIINMYSSSDKLIGSVPLAGITDFIDIEGKKLLYNIGRDVFFGRINSKSILKYTAAMDIKKLMIISNDTFVIVYSNSLEIVTV